MAPVRRPGCDLYGFHMAGQTEGTHYFSVVIFTAPLLAARWLLLTVYQRYWGHAPGHAFVSDGRTAPGGRE
jgi:hypothetical protein